MYLYAHCLCTHSHTFRLYTKAVEHKPDFDIALANLGNAIKDAVRHLRLTMQS